VALIKENNPLVIQIWKIAYSVIKEAQQLVIQSRKLLGFLSARKLVCTKHAPAYKKKQPYLFDQSFF